METGSSYQHGYCYRYFLIAPCCLHWNVSEASTTRYRGSPSFKLSMHNSKRGLSSPSNRSKCARVLNLMHSNDPLPLSLFILTEEIASSLPGFFSSYRYLSAVHSSKRRCLTGRGKKKEREEKWKKVSIPSHRFVSTFLRYDRESFACSTSISHRKRFFFFDLESNFPSRNPWMSP